jgi:hypothetical protein
MAWSMLSIEEMQSFRLPVAFPRRLPQTGRAGAEAKIGFVQTLEARFATFGSGADPTAGGILLSDHCLRQPEPRRQKGLASDPDPDLDPCGGMV